MILGVAVLDLDTFGKQRLQQFCRSPLLPSSMRGKEGVAEKDKVSEGKAKEEEASTAPLPEKVSS